MWSSPREGISQWIKHSPVTMAARFEPRHGQRFFSAPNLSGTPLVCTLSLSPMACSNPGNWWLVMGEIKEKNHGMNPNSAICEANIDTRATYGRNGVLKKFCKVDVEDDQWSVIRFHWVLFWKESDRDVGNKGNDVDVGTIDNDSNNVDNDVDDADDVIEDFESPLFHHFRIRFSNQLTFQKKNFLLQEFCWPKFFSFWPKQRREEFFFVWCQAAAF